MLLTSVPFRFMSDMNSKLTLGPDSIGFFSISKISGVIVGTPEISPTHEDHGPYFSLTAMANRIPIHARSRLSVDSRPF